MRKKSHSPRFFQRKREINVFPTGEAYVSTALDEETRLAEAREKKTL